VCKFYTVALVGKVTERHTVTVVQRVDMTALSQTSAHMSGKSLITIRKGMMPTGRSGSRKGSSILLKGLDLQWYPIFW
jgi:hypothetical protein